MDIWLLFWDRFRQILDWITDNSNRLVSFTPSGFGTRDKYSCSQQRTIWFYDNQKATTAQPHYATTNNSPNM